MISSLYPALFQTGSLFFIFYEILTAKKPEFDSKYFCEKYFLIRENINSRSEADAVPNGALQ